MSFVRTVWAWPLLLIAWTKASRARSVGLAVMGLAGWVASSYATGVWWPTVIVAALALVLIATWGPL